MRHLVMALAFVALAGSGLAQTQTTEMAKLQEEVAELRKRVTHLEQRVAELQPNAAAMSGRAPLLDGQGPRLYAIVDRIESVESQPGEADTARIRQLETEIGQLEQTIAQISQDVAQAGSQSISVSTGTDVTQSQREREAREQSASIRSQRQSQGVLLARYRDQLARKQAQLRDLTEGQTGRRQVIHAHRGDLLLRLESKRDLMASQDIQPGPQWRIITWEGRLIEGDTESQRWEITRIDPLDPSALPAEELAAEQPEPADASQ